MADVLWFRTIRGRRRLAYIFAAILIGGFGVSLVGISRAIGAPSSTNNSNNNIIISGSVWNYTNSFESPLDSQSSSADEFSSQKMNVKSYQFLLLFFQKCILLCIQKNK